jgi:DNA replication protein DnaC
VQNAVTTEGKKLSDSEQAALDFYKTLSPIHELILARADGTYVRVLTKLARLDVLVIDDWGLAPVQDQERRDLLEILEDRYGTRSTIVTSQLPPAQWHEHIGDATLADAICDRLLHNAHRLVLKGPSRRKEAKLDS